MNTDRLKLAIEVFKRAEAKGVVIYFSEWQTNNDGFTCLDESDFYESGKAASFAGFLALSPEWEAAGGRINPRFGTPIFKGFKGSEAIARFFECTIALAKALEYSNLEAAERLYNNDGWTVTPSIIVGVLESLLENGVPKEFQDI